MILKALLSIVLMFSFVPFAIAKQPDTHEQIVGALKAWNSAANRGDIDGFMDLFDQSAPVILAGSDKGEVFRGKSEIRAWLSGLFEHHRFSWDLSKTDIDSNGDTAWVFVDGTMTVTKDSGEVTTTPYRFSGVMTKHGSHWKWRMFNGSIPAGE